MTILELYEKLDNICGVRIGRAKKAYKNLDMEVPFCINTSDSVNSLEYESVRADAYEMAFILDKIDDCLHTGCACEGNHEGGIPSEITLARLCKIMYSHNGCYHKWRPKFFTVGKQNTGEKE